MPVHLLFENPDWMPPVRNALDARGIPYVEHFIEGGSIDVSHPPPEGVYWNRMSPSSHTRGHQGGVAFVREYLPVLEAHGRRVINGSRAFALEVSKIKQHAALTAFGIDTPRTLGVVGGPEALMAAARGMDTPFITKDNQGGKGLGVRLFRELDAFDTYVNSDDFVAGPDGVTLLQQYIEPPEPYIVRVEIVGGEFLYAIRSSTEQGFELCPSDACAIDDQMCPVGESPAGLFTLAHEITADDPLVKKYLALCEAYGIDMAGIEYVIGRDGRRYTYDINGTSNYNSDVEAENGVSGMAAMARLCEGLLT